MRIDFHQEIKTIDGKPIPGANGGEKTFLKEIAVNSLLATFDDERNLSGEEKAKRWVLAVKIQGEAGDFTLEEAEQIKRLIGKGYPPLVVGQAWRMLEEAGKPHEVVRTIR